MIRIIFITFFIFLNSYNAFATPDIRISDNDGDILDIGSDGTVQTSDTNDGMDSTLLGSADIRISDNDGDILDINPDGSVTVVAGAPY